MEDKKRKNFSVEEKSLLIEIVNKYVNIIDNKKSDAVSVSEKKKKWQEIAAEFNESNEIHVSKSKLFYNSCCR